MNRNEVKAYIAAYLTNCGQDLDEWSVNAMADALYGELGGASPDEMDGDSFTAFLEEWGGCVADTYGEPVDFEAAAQLMDDELREELHDKMAPCSRQEFFDAYAKRHHDKFGDDFAPYVGAAW